MEKKEKNIFVSIDWPTIIIYLILILFGWINIYAAVYDEAYKSIWDFNQLYGKQLIWVASSILLGIFILVIDPKFFTQTAYATYGFFLFLLVVVLITATATKGAKSWFGVGDFGIQPSEFAKFATALALAKFLSSSDVSMAETRTKIISFVIILIPAALVLLQNDTGSALVFGIFILVLFREGLSGNILLFPFIAAILFVLTLLINQYIVMGIALAGLFIFSFFIKRNLKNILNLVGVLIVVCGFIFCVDLAYDKVLAPHQRERIDVLLGKIDDLQGIGYNVNQSKIAIGSGGLFGKGFMQGTQTKYNFVPEQSTDFIFCTVGEEWGFLGSFILISLYLVLFARLISMAERQRSIFARVYGYCVAAVFFMHFFVNIGMTIGLLPVIGIPLPFLSYGGSSLWAFTILLFIFIRQDASRTRLI